MTANQRFLTIFVLLALAFTCNWTLKTRPVSQLFWSDLPLVRQFVPERLRSFVAAYLWSRAETIMHRGPLPLLAQRFPAGSYAGNTDIVPLLQMVILLMPEELPPYQLLAGNLARYLGDPVAGLRIIQQGILHNARHPAVHELYASAAFIKMFALKPADETRKSALKYLARAAQTWSKASAEYSSDPALRPDNYAFLQARLLLELKRPADALSMWNTSGASLDSATDRLGEILRHYRDTGVVLAIADSRAGDELTEKDSVAEIPEVAESKAGSLPLLAMLYLLTGAGLLLIIVMFASHRFA